MHISNMDGNEGCFWRNNATMLGVADNTYIANYIHK